MYDKSPDESDEEWDMLENANGLTHTLVTTKVTFFIKYSTN